MWTRKIYANGGQKTMSLPKELTEALRWNFGDQLLVACTGRNIITVTRIEADKIPESILRQISEVPTIEYAR